MSEPPVDPPRVYCRDCGQWIEPGDVIAWEDGFPQHWDCADDGGIGGVPA